MVKAFTIKCYKDDNITPWSAITPTTDDIVDGLRGFYPTVHATLHDVVQAEQYSTLQKKVDDILARVERYCADPEADESFVKDMIGLGMNDPFNRDYDIDLTVAFRIRFSLSGVSTENDVADIDTAIGEQLNLAVRKGVENIKLLDTFYPIENFSVEDAEDWEIEIEEV